VSYREVYKIKRKIISISIVLLLLAIIPSISIATVTPTQDEDILLLLGTIIVNEIENDTVHALAIRLRYVDWNNTSRSFGWITLNKVIFPDGFFMIPIGRFSFVIGISSGGIEIE